MKRMLLAIAVLSLAFPMLVVAQSKPGTKPTESEAEFIERLEKEHRLSVAKNQLEREEDRVKYEFVKRIARSSSIRPFFNKGYDAIAVPIAKNGRGMLQISSDCFIGAYLYIRRDGSLSSNNGIINCKGLPLVSPKPINTREDFTSSVGALSLGELKLRIVAELERIQ